MKFNPSPGLLILLLDLSILVYRNGLSVTLVWVASLMFDQIFAHLYLFRVTADEENKCRSRSCMLIRISGARECKVRLLTFYGLMRIVDRSKSARDLFLTLERLGCKDMTRIVKYSGKSKGKGKNNSATSAQLSTVLISQGHSKTTHSPMRFSTPED